MYSISKMLNLQQLLKDCITVIIRGKMMGREKEEGRWQQKEGNPYIYKFYQFFKIELTPIVLKVFSKLAWEIIPKLFCEGSVTLVPEPSNALHK